MNQSCRGNQGRLIALLDGSLGRGAADRLRAHLRECQGCAQTFARLQAVRGICRELGEVDPPEINYRQVQAQVQWKLGQKEPQEQPRPLRLGLIPALSLALALAVGGVLLGVWIGGARLTTAPPAARATAKAAPKAPIERAAARSSPAPRDLAALPMSITQPAYLMRADARSPLSLHRPLLAKRDLQTGPRGEAVVQWGEGTGLHVVERSRFRFEELTDARQVIHLLAGKIELQVARRLAGQRFEVIAGDVRVTVRGTRFSVALIDAETVEIQVAKGLVAVSPVNGRWSKTVAPADYGRRLDQGAVLLRAGYRLRAVAGRPPEISAESGDADPRIYLMPWRGLAHTLAANATLQIESRAPGAEARLDSVPIGRTNLSVRSATGRHLIALYRDGKLLRQRWVELAPGAALRRVVLDHRPQIARRVKVAWGIQETFRQRAALIRACYERRLKRDPSLSGRVVLRVSVDDSGAVSEAKVQSDTLSDKNVGRCALTVIKSWRFAPNRPTSVVYPFVFRPR